MNTFIRLENKKVRIYTLKLASVNKGYEVNLKRNQMSKRENVSFLSFENALSENSLP